MEKGRKESHIEGVAIHGDPESCAVARKGAGEALTGARAGRAIEPRNDLIRGADAVKAGGRQHHERRYRKPCVDPARSKNPCTHGISMRENRDLPHSLAIAMARRAAQGRPRPQA